METPGKRVLSGGRRRKRGKSLHGDRRGRSQRAGGLGCLWDEGKSFHKDMVYYVMAFWLPQTCRLTLRCLCQKSCLRVYVCHGWVGGYLFKWLMGEKILELLLPHRDPVSLPPLLWTLCLRSPGSWV